MVAHTESVLKNQRAKNALKTILNAAAASMERYATKKSPRCAYSTCRIIFHANLTSNVFPNLAKKVFVEQAPLKFQKNQQSEARSRQFRLGACRASPPRSRQPQSTASNTGKRIRTPDTNVRTFRTRLPSCSTTRRRCRTTTATRVTLITTGSQPLKNTPTIASVPLPTIPRHHRITTHHIRMTA
jgi:hypothetical protein